MWKSCLLLGFTRHYAYFLRKIWESFVENFFLAGEVKYIPLKVKPYEDEVDLSGIRCSGGIGYTFKF